MARNYSGDYQAAARAALQDAEAHWTSKEIAILEAVAEGDFGGDLCTESIGTGRKFWLDGCADAIIHMHAAAGNSTNVWT